MTDQNDVFDEEDNLFDEIDGIEEEAAAVAADLPTSYVMLNSAGGGARAVPVLPTEETDGMPGVTVREVLRRSGLVFGQDAQFLLGNAVVGMDFLVHPGDTITATGNQKGG